MSEGAKKKINRIRIVLGIFFILILAALCIGGYSYITDNIRVESDEGKSKESHKTTKIYNKSDLDAITGVQLRESEDDMGEQECVRYWNNRATPTIYDSMTFYVYQNEKKAKKALKYIKENAFKEITDEGDIFVQGWLADVFDAEIEAYYYVSGNLIVEAWVDGYSEWPISDEDEETEGYTGPKSYDGDIRELIKKTF